MFESVQRGLYFVGDKEVYFRSKWEANYCLYLEFLKKNGEIVDYQYEPYWLEFPIKHGTTRYLPDFMVTTKKTVEIHEVKGFLTPKGKTQLKRVAKYYPQFKVVLVDSIFMKDLKKKWGKLLKFY